MYYEEPTPVYDDPHTSPKILPEVRIFWLAIAVFIAVAIIGNFLSHMPDRWNFLENVFLAMTLIAVSVSSYLSYRTQQSMVQQINVSILPIMEVNLVTAGDLISFTTAGHATQGMIRARESYIELINVGQGAALNLTIDDIVIPDASPTTWGDPVWFGRLSALQPREKARIQHLQIQDLTKVKVVGMPEPDALRFLNARHTYRDYELVIRFTDMLGNEYAQPYRIGRRGQSPGVIRPSKDVARITIEKPLSRGAT